VTFDFESGTQDWTVTGGTFARTNAPPATPPASGSYMQSSGAAPLGPGCDEIRSPQIILTASSTLSLANQFVTEPDSQDHWYDRANVGLIVGNTRTVVDPDSGRAYNASAGNPENTSLCTNLQNGWAGTGAWDSSSWSAGALGSAGLDGTPVRISVMYGTDPTASLAGFMFDQVTITNVHYLAPDAQSNICAPPPRPDLVVANVTSTNNKAREGDKVTIIATVKNQGNAVAGVSTTRFLLDGTTLLGEVPTAGLAPSGGEVPVSVQWDTRSVKGQHVITVMADALETITESIENNNGGTFTVEVQGNKVKNGSFEQSNSAGSGPEAWSGSSTGAGSASWSDGGSDGSKSASASGNGGSAAASGSPSWTSDPIAVVPGEVLTLTVSVQSQAASSTATAGLVYLGAAGNVLSTVNLITAPLTTTGFAKLQQAVTIPAGVSQVRVKLVGFSPADLRTSGTVRFDEVGLFGN
jgi:hypothetical protein